MGLSRRAAITTGGTLLFGAAIYPTSVVANEDESGIDWRSFGGDDGNTGYNSSARVPKENISELWRFDEFPDFPSGPAVADGMVYFGTFGGEVLGVEASSGQERWRTRLSEELGDIPDDVPTPAVADGSVYLGSKSGQVFSLDTTTGKVDWKRNAGSEITTPVEVSDGRVYAVANGVTAMDAESGDEIWEFSEDYFFDSGLAVVDGTVYVGSTGGTMYALNSDDGSVVWKSDVGDEVRAPPAVADGTVYIGTDAGDLFALDTADGSPRWTTNLDQELYTSPAVSEELVFAGGETGSGFYAIDRSSGSVEWEAKISEKRNNVRASPAVADGVVFITDGDLRAIDIESGEDIWRYPRGDFISSPPAVVDGAVLVGNWDASMYAISNEQLKERITELQPPSSEDSSSSPSEDTSSSTSGDTSSSSSSSETERSSESSEPSTSATEEPVQRGFLSNGNDEQFGMLSDPFLLTVGGFALSVIGVLHSMIGGK